MLVWANTDMGGHLAILDIFPVRKAIGQHQRIGRQQQADRRDGIEPSHQLSETRIFGNQVFDFIFDGGDVFTQVFDVIVIKLVGQRCLHHLAF